MFHILKLIDISENNNMKHLTYITYFNMCRINKRLKYKTASIRYIVEIALSKAFYFLFMAGFPLARTIEMWKASSVFARISYCIWWVRPFFSSLTLPMKSFQILQMYKMSIFDPNNQDVYIWLCHAGGWFVIIAMKRRFIILSIHTQWEIEICFLQKKIKC